MANLKNLLTQPTKPALRDGAHKMILTTIECPEVEDNKTPYILMSFKDIDNNQTYTKYMFENDINFFTRNIKEMLDVAETETPLGELCDALMTNKTVIPVFVHTVDYTGLDNVTRTTKNWYFVTDYVPTEKNTAEER